MTVPKNLLPLGHLTGTEGNTLTKQRQSSLKKSDTRPVLLQADVSTHDSHQHPSVHLLQRWQELKQREITAQQHNRQLLQQFEEAQTTLREMLTLTTNMKTIRMEYERYLDESAPRWQQQLKEKTQAAQKKRLEVYFKSRLKNKEDQGLKSSAEQPLQAPIKKKIVTPETNYSQNSHDYNQDGSCHLPYTLSSWQNHPQSQMARFPIRAPHQSQGSSHVPPPYLSHPFHTSMPSFHPWPRLNAPCEASTQPGYPWSWTSGIPFASEALWGQLYMEEPPPESRDVQVVTEGAETSRASSSKRSGGGSRSSNVSHELDIKPVRLSSDPAESSESSRKSSQVSREKRGRSGCTSSDSERCSSQETSSAIIPAAATASESSESDDSTEKGRKRSSRRSRSAGLAVGSPRAEMMVKESTRSNREDMASHKEESQSSAEESGSGKELCRETSGSQREKQPGRVSLKIEKGGESLSSSSEESSVGEKEEDVEHVRHLREGDDDDGDKKEDSQEDGEQEEGDVEDDDISEREEEERTGAEEGMEEQESEEDQDEKSDGTKQGSASSQEDESEDKKEDESDQEEGGEEGVEEQRRDGQAEVDSDSEDSIISPQNKSKKLNIIPEEAREEEESKAGSSGGDSSELSDEDIEDLLAPQQQTPEKEEKDLRTEEEAKAVCDKVEIFQVESDTSAKTDQPSDSEEFDHFYD